MVVINAALMAALDDPAAVRPFPTVASKLLSIPDSGHADFSELTTVLECDPAVCLELLRVANSSLYGFPGQINSVRHATVILGFREVKNLAVSLAAKDVFHSRDKALGMDLWFHSLGCAVVARRIAQHWPDANPDEAFLGGILHDIGKLVFLNALGEQYLDVINGCTPFTITSVEEEHFGISHEKIGQQCSDKWGLPMHLDDVIGFHHDLAEAQESQLLNVVQAANCLSRIWGIGCEKRAEGIEDLGRLDLPVSLEALETAKEPSLDAFEALKSSCAT